MNKMFLCALLAVAMVANVAAGPRDKFKAGKGNASAFPDTIVIPTGIPNGFRPEGFAIGRGTNAYAGSVTGAIYKADLRTGEGEMLVQPIVTDLDAPPFTLGMRVDVRTNYLFVAGGFGGNALVYDADTGELVANYQLADPSEFSVINDLTITKDAVYFTDSFRDYFYRLPLSKGGELPADSAAAQEIPLSGDYQNDFNGGCCKSNGIVAPFNGSSLIIGNTFLQRMFKVDPETGFAERIMPDVTEFPDGMILQGNTLYILHPAFGGLLDADQVTVMELNSDYTDGFIVGTITDPSLSGIASGARFGSSLYVINARYFDEPSLEVEYFITKLKMKDVH